MTTFVAHFCQTSSFLCVKLEKTQIDFSVIPDPEKLSFLHDSSPDLLLSLSVILGSEEENIIYLLSV